MKDLKCGMKNCRYNKGYCCCAKQIDVTEETDCSTYLPEEGANRSLFEAGSDFVKSDYSVDTKVSCGAKCIFNRAWPTWPAPCPRPWRRRATRSR